MRPGGAGRSFIRTIDEVSGEPVTRPRLTTTPERVATDTLAPQAVRLTGLTPPGERTRIARGSEVVPGPGAGRKEPIMADDESPDQNAEKRPQDPLVDRLRPDPSQPPEPTRTLQGLLGDSDRSGFRRV